MEQSYRTNFLGRSNMSSTKDKMKRNKRLTLILEGIKVGGTKNHIGKSPSSPSAPVRGAGDRPGAQRCTLCLGSHPEAAHHLESNKELPAPFTFGSHGWR